MSIHDLNQDHNYELDSIALNEGHLKSNYNHHVTLKQWTKLHKNMVMSHRRTEGSGEYAHM